MLGYGLDDRFRFQEATGLSFSPPNPGLLWGLFGSLSNGSKSFLWWRVKLHVMPRLNFHEPLYLFSLYIFITWYPLATLFRYTDTTKLNPREGAEDGLQICSFPRIVASRSISLRPTSLRPKHLSVTNVNTLLSLQKIRPE